MRIPKEFFREYSIPFCVALFFFILQARHLGSATWVSSDEGVYALAGVMMMKGYLPHAEIPLWHMPLLPLLIGVGIKIFHSLHFVRIIFLAANCMSVALLWNFLTKVTRNVMAATATIIFYLSFHEMVHHDFRFMAIRQLANILLLAFFVTLYVHGRRREVAQWIISISSAFLFIPSFLHVIVASAYGISTSRKWWHEAERYFIIFSTATILVSLYLLLIPEALQQVVVDQAGRGGSRIARMDDIFLEKDRIFLLLGLVGLAVSLMQRKTRALGAVNVSIVVLTIFLPSTFMPHYVVTAAPSMAFGIFVLFNALTTFSKTFGMVIMTVCLSLHAMAVGPSLLQEWVWNRNASYTPYFENIGKLPEPIFTVEPILAAGQFKEIPAELLHYSNRPPIAVTKKPIQEILIKSCSISLDGSTRKLISVDMINREDFREVYENPWGKLFISNRPECQNGPLISEE